MYERELKVALDAAKVAGKIVLERFGKQHTTTSKGADGFVTEADFASEKAIISRIKKAFPTNSILAEESGMDDNKSAFCWAIDPVDGTHNFMRGVPLYGVSIALLKNFVPVLGVLCLPSLGEIYYAVRGKGAWRLVGTQKTRIHVSD